MKFGFYPESIVDTNGKPLVGRVTLFVHDTDTLLDVFTIEGENYVQAANPKLLNAKGRLDSALFFEAAVIDVRIEKYVGAEGQMSATSPDRDFRPFAFYEYGFDPSDIVSVEFVDTIAELMNTPTTSKYITVMGYYGAGDCMPRTYYWDSEAEDEIDGGYVVGSNLTESGRWILLWNSEQLPCSVYGIIAGVNESNMNAFLSYPAFVGSVRLKTSPIARFERGEYSTDVNLSSEKTVAFDTGAKFPSADLYIKRAVVNGSNSDFIADMFFSDTSCEAHSSWFRTVEGFLKCGAESMFVDRTNYFSVNGLTENVTVTSRKWIAGGRLPVEYSGTGRITFDGCSFVGSRFFDDTDRVSFARTVFHDDWFAMTSTGFDFDNMILCRSASLNTIELANFKSADTYVKAITADGRTTLDLSGRSVESLSTEQFTEIRNALIGALDVDIGGSGDIVLDNVVCENVELTCRFATVRNSTIKFDSMPTAVAMWFSDSKVESMSPWTNGIQIEADGCTFGISLKYAHDNVSDHSSVTLKGCNFTEYLALELKRVSMYRCVTDNANIKIFPHKVGNDYILTATLENNVFSNNNPVEFTKFEFVDNQNQEDVYDCIAKWRIVGNTFTGNEEGLRCRYWQNRNGNNPDRVFIRHGADHDVVYSGNFGKCPGVDMKGIYVPDNSDYSIKDVGGSQLYCYGHSSRRVMPSMPHVGWWGVGTIADDPGTMLKYYGAIVSPYDDLTFDTFIHNAWGTYFLSVDDEDTDGDFFLLAIETFGSYIRIVQSGDGDHNHFVEAKIV